MIATTIEQSKHLIELGVDVSTADMCYVMIDTEEETYSLDIGKYIGVLPSLPSWSLSALLKMFPNGLWYNNDYAVPILLPQIKNKWICRLYNPEKDIDIFYIKDNPLDAVFEMICWLKEKYK